MERRYLLGPKLGDGGCGVVHRGTIVSDGGFTKEVAIKLLHPGLARPEGVETFFRDEAHILARLKHRAIVHIDDFTRIDDQWALVMEYVEGVELGRLVDASPAPIRATCEIIAELAGALAVSHAAGVTHRDIKPGNILVTAAGEIKLLDFGIAHVAGPWREANTSMIQGKVLGTLHYLAPERFQGLSLPSSDIYPLGKVAWECLVGESMGLTFTEARARPLQESLDMVATCVPEPSRAAFVEFLWRMLRFDHEDRPSAEEVEETFLEFAHNLPGEGLRSWAARRVAILRARGAQEPPIQEPSAGAPSAGTPSARVLGTIVPSASSSPIPREPRVKTWMGLLAAGALLVAASGGLLNATADFGSKPVPQAGTQESPAAEPASVEIPAPPTQDLVASEPAGPDNPPSIRKGKEDKSEKAPSKVAASDTPLATLRISGDIRSVTLRSRDGTWSQGNLPAGTYSVEATLSDGYVLRPSAPVVLSPGQILTLNCSSKFHSCRNEP